MFSHGYLRCTKDLHMSVGDKRGADVDLQDRWVRVAHVSTNVSNNTFHSVEPNVNEQDREPHFLSWLSPWDEGFTYSQRHRSVRAKTAVPEQLQSEATRRNDAAVFALRDDRAC